MSIESTQAVQRVRKQRQIRKAAGWFEVKVWVTSEEEADAIRELASSYREKKLLETKQPHPVKYDYSIEKGP